MTDFCFNFNFHEAAAYERLESGFNGLEEDEATDQIPAVNTTRVLLPSEIAQLSQRPTDDPYYVASLYQNTSNPISQLPEYSQITQLGTQCAGEPHKSAPSGHQAIYCGDLPPTYVDATAQNPSGSPGNT